MVSSKLLQTVMKKIISQTLIFFFLVFTLLASQVSLLAKEDLTNPNFMRILNNYYGCKTWANGICVQCSERYYFNNKGICCEVQPQCKIFNRDMGICEGCYQGYRIANGICVVADLQNSADKGCAKWNNGVCTQCSVRWYFGQNKLCYPVDNYCRKWKENGLCQECYNGYIVRQNKCILNPNQFIPLKDSLCALWKDRTCLRCAERAYFDQMGICKGIDTNCYTWDLFDGYCLSCYKGYNLKNGACILASNNGPSDLGCKTWDWESKKCLKCSARWNFNLNGVCVPVNSLCATFDSYGACTKCYKGYTLQIGSCVVSTLTGPTDLGCSQWDWDNQKCLACSPRWVFGANGLCVPVDSFCSAFDRISGLCTACYKGYTLNKGVCVLAKNTEPNDIGCKVWDWDNQKCLQCSQRWSFNQAFKCVPISDFCSNYTINGQCTSCYPGYQLLNGDCQIQNLLCKTFSSGKCTGCYNGYVLYKSQCVPLSKLANLYQYYLECCPDKLATLKAQKRLP